MMKAEIYVFSDAPLVAVGSKRQGTPAVIQGPRVLTPGAVTVALKKVVWSEGKEDWIGRGVGGYGGSRPVRRQERIGCVGEKESVLTPRLEELISTLALSFLPAV